MLCVLTDVVNGENLAVLATRIKYFIDHEQKRTIWFPSGNLWWLRASLSSTKYNACAMYVYFLWLDFTGISVHCCMTYMSVDTLTVLIGTDLHAPTFFYYIVFFVESALITIEVVNLINLSHLLNAFIGVTSKWLLS